MRRRRQMVVDCAVVGAGPAGLAASAALTARDVEHVVLARGRVGERWRTQRWDSFRLNTPGWMNQLLGEQAPDGYATGVEVVQRLEKLAADCPVRDGVRVSRPASSPGSTPGWSTPMDSPGARTPPQPCVASGSSGCAGSSAAARASCSASPGTPPPSPTRSKPIWTIDPCAVATMAWPTDERTDAQMTEPRPRRPRRGCPGRPVSLAGWCR